MEVCRAPVRGGSEDKVTSRTEPLSSGTVLRFGEFEADPEAGCLSRQGREVRLRRQLFTILSVLLEHAGEVVTREELQKRLWPGDVVVDFEINLNTLIARLREALGDSAETPRYIETLPKRGYRFIAPVVRTAASVPVPLRRLRLIVLPFADAGGSPDEYVGDTMTEGIITALCQVAPERLAVIARTTSMHYKNSRLDIAQVGREIGADYVVEGAVRRSSDRMAVNVQLIQAADQTHVYAGKYDAGMDGLFDLQTRVAGDLVKHIPAASGESAGTRVRKKPTEDPAAYELYLQGRHLIYKLNPLDLAKAKACLDEAIAHDPRFALAYDALGEIYWWTAFYGFLPPRQAGFAGLGAVLRALEIDPTLGESHSLLGQFRQKLDYNWPEVRREMDLALELSPSSPLVRMRYAVSDLLPHGRLEEAVAQVERGLEFDPLSWELRTWLSVFLWLARDYDLAMREARFSQALQPGNFMPPYLMACIARESGNAGDALVLQRRAVEMSGGSPQMLGWLGMNLARGGDAAGARAVLERLRTIAAKTYVPPTSFAWVHAGLGEFDDALAWIERAIDDRDSFIIPIKTYAFFDPLRADPRFQALLRRMNLEP